MNGQRIYLDNAATSWPKPETVYQAVDYYQRELGATTGAERTVKPMKWSGRSPKRVDG